MYLYITRTSVGALKSQGHIVTDASHCPHPTMGESEKVMRLAEEGHSPLNSSFPSSPKTTDAVSQTTTAAEDVTKHDNVTGVAKGHIWQRLPSFFRHRRTGIDEKVGYVPDACSRFSARLFSGCVWGEQDEEPELVVRSCASWTSSSCPRTVRS